MGSDVLRHVDHPGTGHTDRHGNHCTHHPAGPVLSVLQEGMEVDLSAAGRVHRGLPGWAVILYTGEAIKKKLCFRDSAE